MSSPRSAFALAAVGLLPLMLAAQTQTAAIEAPEGFAIEVQHPRLPCLSQDNTGTCWSYATVSFFESELERIHGESIDLSEMHTVYWAFVEKARRYVRLHGNAQFSQGGLSHDLLPVARFHGVVPAAAYSGLRDGAARHDHGELETLLKAVVEKVAKSRRPSPYWEDAVRGVLDAYLGPVPDTVTVHGQETTPQRYASEVLQLPLGDYVQLMSYSYTLFDERGELLVPDNWMRYDDYWNVRVDELIQNLDNAVRKGFTVAIDIDVSERSSDRRAALYQLTDALEKKTVTDALRQRTFDSRETTDDHLMHVVGIAKGEDGRIWYLTKNSWGDGGPMAGHWLISRNYMALKLLAFMVHRDGLLAETREKFERAG